MNIIQINQNYLLKFILLFQSLIMMENIQKIFLLKLNKYSIFLLIHLSDFLNFLFIME